MFLNLGKGSILYGVDRQNDYRRFTASIEKITQAVPRVTQTAYGQVPEMAVDIVAIINGEQKEFKQVPSNSTIADFGPTSIILADSRDSLYNYVDSLLQKSENIVNSADEHKRNIPYYKKVLNELRPVANDEAVTQLKDEVGSLKAQLAEAIALLKEKTNKPEQ